MNRPSIVARRFADFIGKTIAVRFTWSGDIEPLGELGELVDVVPIGKDYFLNVRIRGRLRMFNTRAVLELAEA